MGAGGRKILLAAAVWTILHAASPDGVERKSEDGTDMNKSENNLAVADSGEI